MHKDFIALTDFSSDQLHEMVDLAIKMKAVPDEYRSALAGKTLGMIFNKHSTRTRISFESGIYQLGGVGLYFGPGQLQLDRGEPISDTAQVLSRYLDGIMIRTFKHSDVEDLGRYGSIPVINGLTDYNHPCQVMADMMTIQEKLGKCERHKLCYIGDGNNMAVSLLFGAVKFGVDISIVSPADYTIDRALVAKVAEEANERGCKVTLTESLEEGASGAHAVYTDVWASMGQEDESNKRVNAFDGFQVNDQVMSWADKDAIFMHCLPAHRGEEVAASVIDGPQSVVFDQAENRLHAQKAIMYTLMR
ncbi:MAG: ornithine carbamoyltransferase [Bdellovibrionales bacterium]|jgi:ornithine carbamoyltransferase|nr:ornithine carbamoyltransferase [Bdellovibrionales bacterium]MBT3526478.1 ornithine carbamoyltransferase [Bdellovibrionales bacterium]MBT7765929.1 ornithine carbamoyltransferase [Bdellovibrionales bacterium]